MPDTTSNASLSASISPEKSRLTQPAASVGEATRTEKSPSKAISRRPANTSLSELLNPKNKPQDTQQATEMLQEATPFTEEELIRCWDTYAEKIEKKVHLKNTMMNCKPVLQDNFAFEVVVHNPGQQEELLNHNGEILQMLRTQLKNGKIQMKTRIDAANEKRLAYTSKEKFDVLNEVNPLLSKLMDEFNLTFD